ncbi:tetratricopeptide repeat protein [Desulfobulbus sp.]|uniref:tetratricopeptide repeat protein n=1 Tax=Desulfobulbus sp. TaxID=895 RepID=UPI0027B9D0A6|nr:tetratricopeptide repeat protein [Desulfobulbus sp.]
MKKRFSTLVVCLLISLMTLSGCSTSEEKVQKFMDKGNALYQKGDYVKAVLEYRNAITIDPGRAEAYYLAGQAELKQGKLQEAYAFFMKTVEKQADHSGANIQLGKLLLGAREFAKSHERVETVLRKEPENQQALLLQGGLLLAERKAPEAKALLEKLLSSGNQEIDLYLLLATAYNQLDDKAAAESVLTKGVTANPTSIPLLVTLANLYLEQKQAAKVEEILRKIMALEPEKAEHVERLAAYFWHEGRKADAEALEQGLLAQASDEQRWAGVAAFYLTRKELEKGTQVLLDGLRQYPKSFRLRFMLKDVYLAGGDFAKALAVAQECLSLDQEDPAFVAAQRGLAELLYRAGNIEAAEKLVAAVLKKSPNDMDGHQLNGSILLVQGELEQAIAEFRTVLQARPKDISLYPKMADALVRNRQNNLALDTLKQGLQIAPDAAEVHLALARLYVLEKNSKDAEAQLQKLVELRPDDLAAKMALADFYAANDGRTKAIQLYKTVSAKVPENPLATMKLSSLYAMEKQTSEAVATVTAGIAANPENNGLLEHGVRLLLQMGKSDQALELTDQRIRRHADDGFALMLQGEIYAANNDFAAAERAYRKAMALNGESPEIAVRLARTLVLAGKAEPAIGEAAQLVGADSPTLSQYVLLAELYKQTGKSEQTLGVYERAVEKFPDNWFILNNLAYYLADGQNPTEQDLSKAEMLAKKAQALAPGNMAVLDTLGWLSYKMGKMAPARAALTMAMAGNSNNPVFSHHLAMVLLKEGKKEEAKVLFEKVARSPGNFSERGEAEKMLKEMAL